MTGIRLLDLKESTKDKPIRQAKLPKKVYIPLSQHTGKPANTIVSVGQRVKVGERIGQSSGFISSNVHSSLSGTVSGIDQWPHPVVGRCLSVVIEGDGSDQLEPSIQERKDIEGLSGKDIKRIVLEAGIVGLGGAAFPTQVKLSPPKEKVIDAFILNGAECEPYLTCDYRVMVERTEEVIKGMTLAMKALDVNRGYIAVEDNKPEAIRQFAAYCSAFPVKVLKTRYPQGAEKQLIKKVVGREVPPGRLPFDVGVVVHNVGTVLAIYEAVYKNKPLYERVITVAGSPLANPVNLKVRLGTPIGELIEDCGPLLEEPAKIVTGGPMMGIAQHSLDVPVIKGTSGILVMSKKESVSCQETNCIKCAKCVDVCPMMLLPTQIKRLVERGLWGQLNRYNILDCHECGCCSFVCPAKIPLVHYIKWGKSQCR